MNIKEYIHQIDADFKDRLCSVAQKIIKTFDGNDEKPVRIVSLSGPTCSGKTTAAKMLQSRFLLSGRQLHIISIDDFYYDREYLNELSRQKGLDTIDYDSVDTIDLFALRKFVNDALSGNSSSCPIFNFKSGNREGYRLIDCTSESVFLFEGIQATYPEIQELFEPYGFVSVFICPQASLTYEDKVFLPDEIRLMRRIVRDNNFRNASAEFTMHLWESVRANEKVHIFPYINRCKYIIDSTHEYELGVLKPYLCRILPTVQPQSKYYQDAQNMLAKLENILPISAELIDSESLYKEFV